MKFTVFAVLIATTVAAVPAQAETFRMECTATRPWLPENNPLGPNEGSARITVTGQIDTTRAAFTFERVTGTGIVRTGWSPFTSISDLGPASKIDWRGADGLPRYYAVQLRTKNAEFWVVGYTERGGRKVMEYYQGVCRFP